MAHRRFLQAKPQTQASEVVISVYSTFEFAAQPTSIEVFNIEYIGFLRALSLT